MSCCLFFFFFQAEDGIRDDLVTGVQTCALPISRPLVPRQARVAERRPRARILEQARIGAGDLGHRVPVALRRIRRDEAVRDERSEERRVGKEGRSWWAGEDDRKET